MDDLVLECARGGRDFYLSKSSRGGLGSTGAYRVILGWGGAEVQWPGRDVDHIASTAELKNE